MAVQMQRRDWLCQGMVGAAGVAAWGWGPLGGAQAQTSTEAPPIDWFVRPARYAQLSLSPDGKWLAAVVPVNGRRNLVVIDLAQRKSQAVTSLSEQDLGGYAWVNNDRLVFWLGVNSQTGLGEQRLGAGLFAVNRDGSDARVLSSPNPQANTGRNYTYRYAQFTSTLRGPGGQAQGNDILVIANERNAVFPDVYRMDTTSGRKTLLSERKPGDAILLRLDRQLAVRAAVTIDDKWTRETLHWRADADADWVAVRSWDRYSADAITPVAFDDQGVMLVAANHQGRQALFRWDAKTRAPGELLVAHPEVDLGDDLVQAADSLRLLAVHIEADRPQTAWFDEDGARMQATIDRALPQATNRLQRAGQDGPVLVSSRSDRDPGRWLLYDPKKRQLEELVSAAPWIEPAQLSERRFVRYAARDGLSIPAYLTLPPKGQGKSLPVVVLVHGGPHLRGETWRFDATAQFLASRGYGVLQPDFRGSTGHGHGHYQAGWHQWGLAMQDDLNDGLAWMVKEGIADPQRAAIMGGSYGGYAVMTGLVRDPTLWRCGINIVGVTDLELLMNASWSDTAQWGGHEHFFKVHIGDPKADGARIAATSPAKAVARLRRPVLMAYGAGDMRVPIEHATRIEAALKATGVPLDFTVYKDEGHGFLREANRRDHLQKVEAFLARHLGGVVPA